MFYLYSSTLLCLVFNFSCSISLNSFLTNGVTVTLSHDNKVITWDCLDDDRCFLLARCCFDVSPQFSANLRQPFHVETGLYNCIQLHIPPYPAGGGEIKSKDLEMGKEIKGQKKQTKKSIEDIISRRLFDIFERNRVFIFLWES